jgi:hypothetical protein
MGYGSSPYGGTPYKYGGASVLAPQTNFINSLTGRCWRYATKAAQGQGFSEYKNGENWIWPEPLMDPITVYDNNGNPRYLQFDEIMGRPYELGTRDGPTSSGMTAAFVDKIPVGLAVGAEIPGKVKFSEYTAIKEHQKIEHKETHLALRPEEETNRGTAGHDSDGFRTAFEAEARLYADGALTAEEKTKDVPLRSDISMPNTFEANRIGVEMETTTSEWRLIRQDTDIEQKDKSAMIKLSHETYQDNIADFIFRVSRYKNPLMDLATGRICSGSYASLTTGPDTDSQSAMVFTGAQGITGVLPSALTGDCTFMFYFYAALADMPITVLQFANLAVTLENNAGAIRLRFNDGANNLTFNLVGLQNTWISLAIVRNGANLTLYEDGALHSTQALAGGVVTYPVTFAIMQNETGRLFDLIVFDDNLDADTIDYYYDMIENHEGLTVLVEW